MLQPQHQPLPCQMKLSAVFITAATCLALVACESKTPASSAPAATAPSTQVPAGGTDTTTATAPSSSKTVAPTYAGTYAVQDTAVCALSITVEKQAGGYSFSCGGIRGNVEVTREDSTTYFTFVGLKGAEPAIDVQAVWEDSVLLIQNSGNSMSEYTRFAQCDAKYLELVRQR